MYRALQLCLISAAMLLTTGVLSILAIDRYRSRPENVIVRNLGQEVRYDDFAFAVLGSREAPGLETSGAPPAAGRYVAVTLRVANHAVRVDFRFKPSSIRLVTEDGAEFRVSAPATAALRSGKGAANACAAPLPAGATCTTDLVFDVPADAHGLRARVGTSTGLLDMVDRVLYGKQLMRLD